MTKSKSTKRALFTSIISMLVCLTMLIGSTFAWFSDSVTSGKNKIVAGNLDVKLEYQPVTSFNAETGEVTYGEWTQVDSDTNLFKPADQTLWEPGHTEFVRLRISNAGSLALKYQLFLNAFGDENRADEKTYTNKDGNPFKLSNYLIFNQQDGLKEVTKREDLWLSKDKEETAIGNMANLGKTGVLQPAAKQELTLAVYMPTSVGNEANQMTSKKATEGEPCVYLGVNLFAAQVEHENDSFGNDYDEKATYSFEVNGKPILLKPNENGFYKNTDPSDTTNYVADEESLQKLSELVNSGDAAIANSDITLAADVTVDENWTPIAKSGSGKMFTGNFDGGGHTITQLSAENPLNYGNGFFGNITGGATIKNVTFENVDVNNSIGETGTFAGNVYAVVAAYTYGNVTFENVHVKNSTVKGFGKIGAIIGMAADPGGTTKLINCTVENTTVAGTYNCSGLIGLAQNEVVLENCSTNNVTWVKGTSDENYLTVDNVASSTEGLIVDGTYWLYPYGDITYAYTGWGDYYTDYYYTNEPTFVVDGTTYTLAHGLCHDK